MVKFERLKNEPDDIEVSYPNFEGLARKPDSENLSFFA